VWACALAGAAGAGGEDHLSGGRQRVQARAAGGQPQPRRQHGPGAHAGLCRQRSRLSLLRVARGVHSSRPWQVPVGWRVPVNGWVQSLCMRLAACLLACLSTIAFDIVGACLLCSSLLSLLRQGGGARAAEAAVWLLRHGHQVRPGRRAAAARDGRVRDADGAGLTRLNWLPPQKTTGLVSLSAHMSSTLLALCCA